MKELNDLVDYSVTHNLKIITTEKDYFRLNRRKIPNIQYLSVKLDIKNRDKFEKEVIKCLF